MTESTGDDAQAARGECTEVDLEVFRQVAEHYRQDVRLFWERSNYFLVTEGLLLAVFFVVHTFSKPEFDLLQFLLIFLGFIIAYYWHRVASASNFWLMHWRNQVIMTNERIQPEGWYGKIVQQVSYNPKYITSLITETLPVWFAAVWLVVVIYVGWHAA